jgi:hypothetical protein
MSTAEKNGTFVLGLERSLGDKLSFSYNALFGDMSRVNAQFLHGDEEQSYHHNLTLNYETSERLSVAFTHIYSAWASDETVSVFRQTAYYVVSDHITLGQRYENTSSSFGFAAESLSVGMNYQNTRWSNVLLRPEIRWSSHPAGSETDFFMDVVITF